MSSPQREPARFSQHKPTTSRKVPVGKILEDLHHSVVMQVPGTYAACMRSDIEDRRDLHMTFSTVCAIEQVLGGVGWKKAYPTPEIDNFEKLELYFKNQPHVSMVKYDDIPGGYLRSLKDTLEHFTKQVDENVVAGDHFTACMLVRPRSNGNSDIRLVMTSRFYEEMERWLSDMEKNRGKKVAFILGMTDKSSNISRSK